MPRLLATLDRERYVAQEMYRRESAVSRSLRVPGLPSSFPVGSVSGSPKLPHAYNVREEEPKDFAGMTGGLDPDEYAAEDATWD